MPPNCLTMVKTGGSIFIALSLVVMLLSLLPLCIVFVRKVAASAILNVLTVLCLFNFLQHLSLTFIQPGSVLLQTGFGLAQFTLSFYLFKLLMIPARGKEIMNMFLASFLSVVITIYVLKGITTWSSILGLVQAVILVIIALIILTQLINNRQIVLINEQGFWIAGGLLAFYGMIVFMESIAGFDSNVSQQIQNEKDLVLLLADMFRLTLFSVGTAIAVKAR